MFSNIKPKNLLATTLLTLFLLLTTMVVAKPKLPKIKTANAETQFNISYNVIYEIQSNGITNVTQEIEIENKENDIMATTYSTSIKQMDIYDVSVKDRSGALKFEEKREDDTTTIKTEIKEQAIGKGRSTLLTLNYKTKGISNKAGEIWNVSLPKITSLEEVDAYNIEIRVPKTFGPEIFMSPKPLETEEKSTETIYTFDKGKIENIGITAAFGKHQILNYNLKYTLINENWFPTIQEIALPPDIANAQQVSFKKIEPKPEKLYTDEDGNVMAEYKVKPKRNLDINVSGSAKIFGHQIDPDLGGNFEDIPSILSRKYTKEDVFWEVDSVAVQDLAKKLFDPMKKVSQNAQEAYNYIIENIEYDFSINDETFVTRKGALATLNNDKKGGCMEFTDLFIALVRAMGIPARELNGYAFNQADQVTPLSVSMSNGDLLHAWAQYYDPNLGWVMVDPTWGNTSGIDYFTKLDTNHFAFVIKGVDSEYPYPAGSYKTDSADKHVDVAFAQNVSETLNKEAEYISLYKRANPFIDVLRQISKKDYYVAYNDSGYILYKFNNEKTLFPEETRNIEIEEGKTPTFVNFNGNKESLAVKIIDKKPKTNNGKVWLGFTVGFFVLVAAYTIYKMTIQKDRNASAV